MRKMENSQIWAEKERGKMQNHPMKNRTHEDAHAIKEHACIPLVFDELL